MIVASELYVLPHNRWLWDKPIYLIFKRQAAIARPTLASTEILPSRPVILDIYVAE